MRAPVSTVQVTRLTSASATQVWRTFADLKARARVFSNVDRVEVLTSEPFGVGVRWREHRDLRDQRLVEELRVVSADPPYSCVVESHGDGADYRVRYEFTPHKRGARLRVHFEAAARGRTGRLLATFFGWIAIQVVEGALRQELDDLAHAAEAAERLPIQQAPKLRG